MRSFDLSSLHRSTIGFDRLMALMDHATRTAAADPWPPFDTLRLGEDRYRIVMAVAGFGLKDITLTTERNLLLVEGARPAETPEGDYLHRGIASRPFTRRFELAEHVQVTAARLEQGLLTIDLQREVPEAFKPRTIAISSGDTPPQEG